MLVIDATSAGDRLTGLERYTCELTKEMVTFANRHICVLAHHDASWVDGLAMKCKVYRSFFSTRLLTEQVWIPHMISRLAPKSCFFPAFPPSPRITLHKSCKVGHTVHDATMWKFPETLSWKNKMYMRPQENFSMPRYDVVHTVSQCSASEISQCFPAVQGKIVVSGNGVDIDRFSKDPGPLKLNETAQHFGLPPQFILFIGTLEPRKNLECLIKAFNLFSTHNSTCGLVLAGRMGWGADEVKSQIAALGLESRILLTGTVSEDELVCLYKLASILAFPSIYEGFGFPVVEAMAAGTPVVASNTSSIPEAAGEAALLLSPHHPEEWAQALQRVLDDQNLREQMREKGLIQARCFSWRAVAEKVLRTL